MPWSTFSPQSSLIQHQIHKSAPVRTGFYFPSAPQWIKIDTRKAKLNESMSTSSCRFSALSGWCNTQFQLLIRIRSMKKRFPTVFLETLLGSFRTGYDWLDGRLYRTCWYKCFKPRSPPPGQPIRPRCKGTVCPFVRQTKNQRIKTCSRSWSLHQAGLACYSGRKQGILCARLHVLTC